MRPPVTRFTAPRRRPPIWALALSAAAAPNSRANAESVPSLRMEVAVVIAVGFLRVIRAAAGGIVCRSISLRSIPRFRQCIGPLHWSGVIRGFAPPGFGPRDSVFVVARFQDCGCASRMT
jgi:hypothetical protein